MTRTNANLFSALTAAFPFRRSACVVVTELLRNAMGTVLENVLRERYT